MKPFYIRLNDDQKRVAAMDVFVPLLFLYHGHNLDYHIIIDGCSFGSPTNIVFRCIVR
jgi:hypothetical protein